MGYGGGANAAKWAYINSGNSHWSKVHAILKNKERSERSSASFSGGPNYGSSSMPHYQPRQEYKEGPNEKCARCGRGLNSHTPAKKWCPKY